ncbi:hypothetical protein C0991_010328 [Blastosporella zonata]|nr:hypothetical protein C0991_010328 [Blastosporella zonata]
MSGLEFKAVDNVMHGQGERGASGSERETEREPENQPERQVDREPEQKSEQRPERQVDREPVRESEREPERERDDDRDHERAQVMQSGRARDRESSELEPERQPDRDRNSEDRGRGHEREQPMEMGRERDWESERRPDPRLGRDRNRDRDREDGDRRNGRQERTQVTKSGHDRDREYGEYGHGSEPSDRNGNKGTKGRDGGDGAAGSSPYRRSDPKRRRLSWKRDGLTGEFLRIVIFSSIALTPTATDVEILNFALTLEHLDSAFYKYGLDKYSQSDFIKAGYEPWVRARYEQIERHEKTHVEFLESALGGRAVRACQYNLSVPLVCLGDVTYMRRSSPDTNVESWVEMSYVFENVGASAYNGVVSFLQDKVRLFITFASVADVGMNGFIGVHDGRGVHFGRRDPTGGMDQLGCEEVESMEYGF